MSLSVYSKMPSGFRYEPVPGAFCCQVVRAGQNLSLIHIFVDQTNYLIYENREYLQGVVTELSELQKIVDSIQPIKLQ